MDSLTKRNAGWQSLLLLASMLALPVAASSQSTAAAAAADTNLYDRIAVARTSPDSNGTGFRVRPNNDLEAVHTTLVEIIAFAYNVHPKRIMNAPPWAGQIAFDLTLHYAGDGAPDDTACKTMLKQALRERFGLVLHGGGERVPSYAIHVEPAGAEMAQSMQMPGTLPSLAMSAPGKLQAHNASVADLAATLQRNVLDRPVMDESGVNGRWDFDLTWKADPAGAGMSTPKTLAEAMRQELGLRLDISIAPPSDVIVDSVHVPSGI